MIAPTRRPTGATSRPAIPGNSTVILHVDGRQIPAAAGTTVAAALLDAGVPAFRRSVSGEGRGPLCGMGTCYECRVTIDGVAHRRSCLIVVEDGMVVETASPGAPA